MTSIFGEYTVSMDAKGRLMIPAEFRKQLQGTDSTVFVLKRGMDKCITFYLRSQWEIMEAKVNAMNELNPKVKHFKRLFLDGITMVEMDGVGRILIPKPLQEYAGFKKEIIFWAQGNEIELWDKDIKDNYVASHIAQLENLTAELFQDI